MNIRNLIPFKASLLSAPINKFLGIALVMLVLLTSSVTSAQVFPVQVSPQLTPPYSLKLSDYSTTTAEKLLVNLLLTDVNESDLQVRLRFSISGNSVRIQSKDFVQNAAPIQLTGGIPLRLSNLDLQPYFDLQNLDGITPSEYNKPLPDGLYQFCFEVFDWTTGRPLSEKKCFPVYLVLNDPPFLNLPQNGEQVPARDPQNLIFQWTPRHVNATGVEYEFELRELWDTQVDPQTAFLASPNLYQTTGFANTLLYGPGETSLLEGKTYGWRVRAVVSNGISETAVFKNGGYSEIFYFTYTGQCDAPQYILAKSEGTTTEEITWQQNPDHINYQIQFRKEGGSNNVWFESETVETKKKLFFLEAETTYEYRVGGQCVQNGGYSYSAVNTFTTPGKEDASEYNCGIPPEIVITNQDPLQQLGVNDVFTAGDFPVTVKEVNGGNGSYTGWGFIVVPYLGDTQIRVSFNNIQINTDKQLTTGLVETEYDEKFATTGGAGMSDISELTELIEGDNDIDNINVNFVIPPDYFEDYITVEDGQVVIRNPNDAQVRTSPLGDDKVIVDSAGNTYHVDAEGNVTKGGKIDEGGPVNADNVEGVTKNGDIESLTAKGITVTFNSRGTYGYDKLPSGINNTKLNEEYKTIKDAQGANYDIVNHVAEKNTPSLITATVSISNSDYTIDDLIFKTKQGELLTHTKATNNTINLSVEGRYTFENEPIYAVVKSKQDTTKQQTAGAFNLWHLSRKTVDVVLVSVDGAQLPTAIELNTIFNQAATTLNIETKSVSLTSGLLGADNELEIGDKPWLNTYNQEQKAIIADLKQKIDYQKDKYYVFTFNSGFNTTKSIAGFMPLKRQFGFVFNGGLSSDEEGKGDLAKVTAHEVAHGIFALQHPFTTYGNDIKGKTPWLMDYANDDLLSHMDWAQIHNPNLKFYIFQDEEDGEQATIYDISALKSFENKDHTYSFVDPFGKIITIPEKVEQITFSTGDLYSLSGRISPLGTLLNFTIAGKKYDHTIGKNSGGDFGYKNEEIGKYQDTITEALGVTNIKPIIGRLVLNDKESGYLFQVTNIENFNKNQSSFSLFSEEKLKGINDISRLFNVDSKYLDVPVSLSSEFNDSFVESYIFSNKENAKSDSEYVSFIFGLSSLIHENPELHQVCNDASFEEFKTKFPVVASLDDITTFSSESSMKYTFSQLSKQEGYYKKYFEIYLKAPKLIKKLTTETYLDSESIEAIIENLEECQCSLKLIPFERRIEIFNTLIKSGLDDYGSTFISLLYNTPTTELKKWFDLFTLEKNNKSIIDIYTDLDNTEREMFIHFIVELTKEYGTPPIFPAEPVDNLVNKEVNGIIPINVNHFQVRNSGLFTDCGGILDGLAPCQHFTTKKYDYPGVTTNDQKVRFTYVLKRFVHDFQGNKFQPNFHYYYEGDPLTSYVKFNFLEDFNYIKGQKEIKANTSIVAPILWAHHFAHRHTERVEALELKFALATLTIITAPISASSTLALGIEVTLGTGEILIVLTDDELRGLDGGEEFIKAWDTLSLTYGAAIIGIVVVKAGKKVLEIDNLRGYLKDKSLSVINKTKSDFSNFILNLKKVATDGQVQLLNNQLKQGFKATEIQNSIIKGFDNKTITVKNYNSLHINNKPVGTVEYVDEGFNTMVTNISDSKMLSFSDAIPSDYAKIGELKLLKELNGKYVDDFVEVFESATGIIKLRTIAATNEITNLFKVIDEKGLSKLKQTLLDINDQDKLARFADEFSELSESLVALNNKPKSAEAWFVLDDMGVDDALKMNLGHLDEVSDLIGSSYKTWKTSSAGINNRLWTNIDITSKYCKVKFLDDVEIGVAEITYTQATKTIDFNINVPPYLQKQGIASEIYAQGLARYPETKIIKEEYIASQRYIGGEPANLTEFKKLIKGTDEIPPVPPKEAAFLTPSGKTIKRNNFDAEPEIILNTEKNVTIQFRRAGEAVDAVGNRLFKNIDEFKAAIAKGDNVFYVGKHTDITPRPTGVQSHHGVNSVWMKAKYSNYSANKAPSVYMLNNPNHNATRGVFNTWAKEMRIKQGVTKVDYSKVTKDDILDLAKKQFDAADTPQLVRDEYYKLWDDYLKTLTSN
ncbi:hypothetical protein M4I21_00455 [Cellulophaga sp. 20_2_10]|uniref:hypothetical protein n=1 Tax=Cellulophaga sp. 20_2_10 TaxID=2942476 RepID=UPI00201A8A38|nr:hypothetical protein [Cellulophaga sp. 20_2_10]MCL5244259.1 hypothetical protein [Cellulophaga sp. 20_2_10]